MREHWARGPVGYQLAWRATHVHDSLNQNALLEEQVRRARSVDGRLSTYNNLLNQYICARAAQNLDGRLAHELCSVPPGRAQREPQGYAGLTSY